MIYYKVRRAFDNKRIGATHFLVANELYTAKEVQKLNIPHKYLDKLDISKRRIYFFFGARFEL